jgi:hypothetical protein
LHWEIVRRNAPRIWRDFGSALPFQTRLTQTKPALPLSNEHGSQVKDQGRRHCSHNNHKKFPCRPTRDVTLLSGHASYNFLLLRPVVQMVVTGLDKLNRTDLLMPSWVRYLPSNLQILILSLVPFKPMLRDLKRYVAMFCKSHSDYFIS